MEKHYAAGEILFREGDPSYLVYRVKSGRVAIIKERPNAPLVLGRVREGEFLGEMGVVEDQPRSATAKAETPLEVEVYETDAFMDLVCKDSALALNLIRRLSIRLRNLDAHIARLLPVRKAMIERRRNARPEPGKGPIGRGTTVAIRGGSNALKLYIGVEPISVPKMPFTVGRVEKTRRTSRRANPTSASSIPRPTGCRARISCFSRNTATSSSATATASTAPSSTSVTWAAISRSTRSRSSRARMSWSPVATARPTSS